MQLIRKSLGQAAKPSPEKNEKRVQQWLTDIDRLVTDGLMLAQASTMLWPVAV